MNATDYNRMYELISLFSSLEEIEPFIDLSLINDRMEEVINKSSRWTLIRCKKFDEYYIVRPESYTSHSKPRITSAVDEISLANKMIDNTCREYPISAISRSEKIGNENTYIIKWCGAEFRVPLSWITNISGREPRRFKNSVLPLVLTVNSVLAYQNPKASERYEVVKYSPDRKHPRVIIEDELGRFYDFRWSDLLAGKEPGLRSSLDVTHNLGITLRGKSPGLQKQLEILGLGPQKNTSTARLIKIRLLKFGTIHHVHNSVLESGKAITIHSAVDPLDYIKKLVLNEYLELNDKIEILDIFLKAKDSDSTNDGHHSLVKVRFLNPGITESIPLHYIQNNIFLSASLGELNHMPIAALVKYNPECLLNFYFIQIIHKSGIKSYKIGYTSYDEVIERVKTKHSDWNLHHCICFEKTTALQVYEIEEKYKNIGKPIMDARYKPKNGYSEFIMTSSLGKLWDSLSTKSLTIETTCYLLESINDFE